MSNWTEERRDIREAIRSREEGDTRSSSEANQLFLELASKVRPLFLARRFDILQTNCSLNGRDARTKSCFSIRKNRNKILCEVSHWNKRTFTAKSLTINGTADVVHEFILQELEHYADKRNGDRKPESWGQDTPTGV